MRNYTQPRPADHNSGYSSSSPYASSDAPFSMYMGVTPYARAKDRDCGIQSSWTRVLLIRSKAFGELGRGYKVVFYGALGLALFGWIPFENALLYVKKPDRSLTSFEADNGNIILEEGDLGSEDYRLSTYDLLSHDLLRCFLTGSDEPDNSNW
ncbi:hypothetical protein Tco_1442473 [Tanacetum coccineum]